ncbi:hypothetical protein Tco_1504160 [Tanacetum coccineum]
MRPSTKAGDRGGVSRFEALHELFIQGLTVKGLRPSRGGFSYYNCLEDSFTPLETIRRLQDTIGRRSHSSLKGKPSSRRGGYVITPYQPKPTPFVQSCQRDPKALGLPQVNQDLLYLKKGNSGPDKIVLSLHKFLVVIFPDDDIEERTSIWVKKCVKRFNPYAHYGVEQWKNPYAKIFYIKNQQAPGKPKEEIYSNLKIVQIIKTYCELGYEHKFIIKIVARRANGSIVSIIESDYKNLNKNNIEDMYL